MVNTLIISDRECIKSLVNFFQPKITGKIDVAVDFDRGLNEIFNKRPATVFIQSEISGIFAETVTKHIKGLLAADCPKIILLWESAMAKIPENGDFDDTFDLSLPEQQLISSFQKLLSTVPGIQWRTQSIGQETAPAENHQPSLVIDKSKIFRVQATPFNDVEGTSISSENEFSDNALDEDVPVNAFSVDLENDALPFNVLRPERQVNPLFKIAAVVIAIGLGFAIYSLFPYMVTHNTPVFYSPTISAPMRPLQAPASSSSVSANHLFTFIPRQANDPAYAIKNPGWERYVDRKTEYLLFRENGVLKAIQVIAMPEESITKEFFHSVLREVTGGEDFIITSTTVSNGYDVQEGMAAGSADIAVYINRKTGVTVAFVISMS